MSEFDPEALKNWPAGNAGFVAIVGRPNVGKSTFLNEVLDFHLVAVSSRPQTTRKNWRGILSDEHSQIIFVDTPGAHIGNTALGKQMLAGVMRSLDDADLILCLADPSRSPGEEDELVAGRVAQAGKEILLLLNKSDITDAEQRQAAREFYLEHLPPATGVFEVSARDRRTLEPVLERVREMLPQGPFFYDPEQVTDSFVRDIGAELIREAALELLYQEVPHALAVEVEEWREGPSRLRVRATLYVERPSQKGIVLGKDGAKIKAIRREAVKPLAELANQPVDLRLHVKVAADWRNKKSFLRNLGLT